MEGNEPRLSPAEIAAYDADGAVVPGWRLGAERIGAMLRSTEELMARNPKVRPEMLLGPHIEKGQAEGLVGHPDFLGYALDEDILDLVESVIGPDIILWGSQLIAKPPRQGFEVPWHQDGQYWPIRPLATCSVTIAITDSTPENGCLRIIPGSHEARRIAPHRVSDRSDLALNQVLDAGVFDETQAREIVLEAGQISLHDVFIMHQSNPSPSDHRRIIYIIRYMPATSHFDRTVTKRNLLGGKSSSAVNFAHRPLWQARGTDVCGRNDFTIGH